MSSGNERPAMGAWITSRAEDSRQQKTKASRTNRVRARMRASGCIVSQESWPHYTWLLKMVEDSNHGEDCHRQLSSQLAAQNGDGGLGERDGLCARRESHRDRRVVGIGMSVRAVGLPDVLLAAK